MIGSKRKRRINFDQFVQESIATEGQLARVECPVGIDIEAVSVTEIAVSIAARLVQKRAEHLTDLDSARLNLAAAERQTAMDLAAGS
jgi:xanthine/CO dehydrogenase XdhC/CoxF family maturation factor